MRKTLLHGRVVLLVLGALALLQAGCGHIRTPYDRASLCPSGSGSGDKSHPLICVSDDLSAHPDTITVWDREQQPNGQPSSFPVTIIWATKSGGGNLGIEFTDKGCLEPGSLHCNGRGRCVARTTRVEKGQVSCSYTINLEGRERDPVVIVQPCCMAP